MAEMVFTLEHVSYQYFGQTALDDINLDIAPGERLVLLGPNGCGKSTLQKVLAGLIFSDGTVRFHGQRLTAAFMQDRRWAAAFRRRVGFVFQNSEVQLFCASVRDELMFGPLQLGLPPDVASERAAELLDMFGLKVLADRPPHRLSGGEKKKLAIAAVLAVNPEVLILDEPTNGLDPRTQHWMIRLLLNLNQTGKTLIIATHQLDIVPDLATRVVVMGENHRILTTAPPETVLPDRALLLKANLVDEHYHVHLHGRSRRWHVHRRG